MNNKALCVLNIGHQNDKPGACNSIYKKSEYAFNSQLAPLIQSKVNNARVILITQTTLQALPDEINALNPDFIISLHANGEETGQASGTEVLYHEGSEKGKRMSNILQNTLVTCLGLPNRGIKPIREGRGHYILDKTKAPCVIAEPFFITNRNDLAKALSEIKILVGAYALAIDDIALEIFQ